MTGAGPARDADIGPRQIDARFRNRASLRGKPVEPLAGQDDDVGTLPVAQAIEQPQRRRKISIDPRAAGRLVGSGKILHRALERERREHPNHILHRASSALRLQTRSLLAKAQTGAMDARAWRLNAMIRQSAHALADHVATPTAPSSG